MRALPLSARQTDQLEFANEPGFLCLSVGAWRSGKTYAAVIAFILYTQALEMPYRHFILARRLRVIEQELLPHVNSILNALGIEGRYNRTKGTLEAGNQIYTLLADNHYSSKDSLQGLTIHSALIDEATLISREFFTMALGRLTFPKSKAWATCNPQGPLHWLKTEYIDQDRVDKMIPFLQCDNPALSQEKIERDNQLLSGVFKLRMIEGLWASGEGLVYPDFQVATEPKGFTLRRTYLGVDVGSSTPSAATAISCYTKRNEKHYHVTFSKLLDSPTDTKLSDKIIEVAKQTKASCVVIDPSASSFRKELQARRKRTFSIRKGRNVYLPGIRTVGALLDTGMMTIDSECKDLIEELSSFCWDDAKQDIPVMENDHCLDALRYASMECAYRQLQPINLPTGF